jgi:ABC-type uncharacterized transport system involved in gliding motility auxiliary subunit
MESGQRNRLPQRLQGAIFYLLFAVGVGLAGWLSHHYSTSWDWSAGGRNSLSSASQTLLSKLEAPLQITSFSPEIPQLRQQINDIVDRYRRYRPDIEFDFINPDTNPDLVRQLGIQVTGELRLVYQGRSENLRTIDEESLSNAIQRLMQPQERWVSALTGHGERSLSGKANHDLGGFGEELQRKGYQIHSLELASAVEIPDNTSLLVIADPQVDYRQGEVEQIIRYLEKGGNLLWMLDPGPMRGLEQVAEQLGLQPLPGTVVDANAATMGLDSPTIALVPNYPDHPITPNFELVTVYPHATALQVAESGEWHSTPLLKTLPRSWNETGPLQGEIKRDQKLGELAGPLSIGIALGREINDKEQRVLLLGDSDFLANTYLGNGGNLQLGINMFRWLGGDDKLLNIPARTAPDRTLELSNTASAIISLGFLFLLPILLLAAGLLVWWRRRNL